MRTTAYYNIAGTKFYRLASKKFFGKGSNLQNIDKANRKLYLADEGYVLNQRDQSGAEALIVAYLCRDGNFRSLFKNGIKPHTYVALHLFKHVWQEKINEGSLDIQCSIDELCNTPIPLLNKNPYWKPLNKLIKSSDDWPPSQRYYYHSKQTCHCVDDKTEVLTRDGWIKIAKLPYNEEIMVWHLSTENMWFEKPSEFHVYDYAGPMYHFMGKEVDQLVTPNHNIIFYDNYRFNVRVAEQAFHLKNLRIPTAGKYIGGNLNIPHYDIKLLAAIQADAWIASYHSVIFRLKRKYKINRLKKILDESYYEYTVKENDDGVTVFNIKNIEHLLLYFSKGKLWDTWLLQFSQNNLQCLIDELIWWDGCSVKEYLHKREYFCSKHFQNVDILKTICHLVNKQGTIGKPDSGVYKMGINRRTKSRVLNKEIVDFSGKVYCPTVSTKYFLIRRNGKISISHNSGNYGVTPNPFILNILEKSKGKVVVSKTEGERFLETYHGLFPEIRADFQRNVEAQVRETRMVFNLLGYPIIFTGDLDQPNAIKECFSSIPQSTVACITRRAVTKMQQYIEAEGKDWDILQDNHDSFVVQCKHEEHLECHSVMKGFLNYRMKSPFDGEEFNMQSEGATGKNWSPYNKDTNPDGLQEVSI